jgi:glycosyltransferase involved in cell wall biosynthesis
MPKVSVIIPTYNMADYLPEAIESVLNQTYKDFEIIVIDDGSTDNTKEIVKKYIDPSRDNIRYIYQENKGVSVARNTAIMNARGEFIALLDADDRCYANRLEEEIKAIEKDPGIGLVHADDMAITENGKCIDTQRRNKKYLSGYIFKNLYIRKANISLPTVLVKKECFEKVGLFDENLTRLGCEDREAWLRIAREYRIEYINKVLAYYRRTGNGMSSNQEKMKKARYYVIEKFFSQGYVSKSLRRIALGRIHRELGDELLKASKYQESRKEYLRSLVYWPFSFWPWINFIKTLLKYKVNER